MTKPTLIELHKAYETARAYCESTACESCILNTICYNMVRRVHIVQVWGMEEKLRPYDTNSNLNTDSSLCSHYNRVCNKCGKCGGQ